MHQVEKAYIRRACAGLREDGRVRVVIRQTSDGDAGERNNIRGGRKQGIAVEIPGKRWSTASVVQKTEGTSLSKLLILIEAGVRPCRMVVKGKQKIAATP